MRIKEIKAKSVLIPSKLPGADYVINPYVGCSFGCKYCYAAFIGRWKHPGEEWGSFLDEGVCDGKCNPAKEDATCPDCL